MTLRPPRFVLIAVAVSGLPTACFATGRNATLSGGSLAIASPCAKHIDIQPDSTLHGQVVIAATAANQQELDQLVLETHGSARIKTPHGRCWEPVGDTEFSPTLTLSIRVPAGFDLAIEESDTTQYTIGAVGGRLDLDLSGDSDVTDAWAASLKLDVSGDGSVEAARVTGATTVELSGQGKLHIDQAAMPYLTLALSGAGSVAVAHGTIGTATLDISGAGSVGIGAEVAQANVDISGSATVHFAKINGGVTKDISGSGRVTVGE